MKTRISVILTHLLFLAGFVSFPVFTMPSLGARIHLNAEEFSRSLVLNNILAAAGYYLNYYYFIPSFNLKRKYVHYTISLLLTACIYLLIPSACNIVLNWLALHFHFVDSLVMPIGPLLMLTLAFMLSYILHKHNEWKQSQRDKMEIEMQKNAAEMILLKNQINPHFFFNTLNGIYALAIRQSDNTASAILQLSQMMRYVLYDSEDEKVLLEKEIAYMCGYVKMQQMRLGSNNSVTFEINGTATGLTIVPLLMIPFIENNFKYGISGNQETRMSIIIDLTEEVLRFRSKNTIVLRNQDDDHKGIGISNVRRRLDLAYHDRHDLFISELSDEFVVQLEIKL
ncbi:Histidine kinase [Chitinophaga sp. YR573]|uniref:sensor histidine kinase n=1 Tax=Chitinophaga sp. YR573 TaxID=1881040 RepID=UPI0008CA474D|nr:histidine kinase [Chitinophaga sp. YR573]SEW38907.1 Histidine kinase [Chitinophaga sp. YR573]